MWHALHLPDGDTEIRPDDHVEYWRTAWAYSGSREQWQVIVDCPRLIVMTWNSPFSSQYRMLVAWKENP